jgi:stress-induced morphogen
MAMEAQDIEALIRESFPKAKITITDLAGDGNHYAAEVIDESFKGNNARSMPLSKVRWTERKASCTRWP